MGISPSSLPPSNAYPGGGSGRHRGDLFMDKTDEQAGAEAKMQVESETRQAMDKRGITADLLAGKLKKELDAQKTVFQKVKGSPNDLPNGVKLITTTGFLEFKENGDWLSDGESLIAINVDDLSIQQRGRMDAHKLRNDYPAEKREIMGKNGRPIEVLVNSPPPFKTIEDWEKWKKKEEDKK